MEGSGPKIGRASQKISKV